MKVDRYLLIAAILLGGCAVGPDYTPPDPQASGLPQAWHARLPHDGATTTLTSWWQQFDDPLMTELVTAAEQGHPSIDAAVGAIREARAELAQTRGRFLPSATASGSATRNGSSASGEAALLSTTADTGTYSLLSGALDASWELDIFGGARRAYQSDSARLSAARADWHEARVSLAAEVADAYVQRRYCERLLALYRDTLDSRRQTERLTLLKLKAGFAAPSDEDQAQAAAYDSENQLIAQEGSCGQDLNRLTALTGVAPADLETRLAATAQATSPAGEPPADGKATEPAAAWRAGIPVPLNPAVPGVPAQILSQRPDLGSAERALAASMADIGVAQASRLPSLTLVGNITVNRIRHVEGSSRSWYWGPSVSLPIFEGGAGLARVEAARARYDQSLASYRSHVLSAVQEVEDALVRVDTSTRRAEAARQSERHYSALLASQENRYRLGATSLLELEDSRRLTLASRQALAAVQLEISSSWIALYKAVGGGWADDIGNPATPIPASSAAAAAPQAHVTGDGA
ncbi:MAG: putative outer rane chanel lipoprotein [Hydrocarboniphaga sp.]|uniref:efflux transporter outer membrane subunit n=1 Tax=Hydrocarboniphaga sp. TaxID=2033016 RepID=UPI002606B85E|nr:efflux transporter outer membrane subunit [Hydrocarboniphaga sp.]MDB5969140.1 putative outer rane chanel lipoprotein [Hydrocarboniphaga sp.]